MFHTSGQKVAKAYEAHEFSLSPAHTFTTSGGFAFRDTRMALAFYKGHIHNGARDGLSDW